MSTYLKNSIYPNLNVQRKERKVQQQKSLRPLCSLQLIIFHSINSRLKFIQLNSD